MDTSNALARNIRALRSARGLTQSGAASSAGIPRATWAHLESGSANPTLQVLLAAADALQVGVAELLAPPRASAHHYAAADLPRRLRKGVEVRDLLPDPLPGLVIERLALPPGSRMSGVPHTAGTREYLTCESGELVLTASGDRFELAAGDVVVFRGDQRHGYHNPGVRAAIAFSVIVLDPALD